MEFNKAETEAQCVAFVSHTHTRTCWGYTLVYFTSTHECCFLRVSCFQNARILSQNMAANIFLLSCNNIPASSSFSLLSPFCFSWKLLLKITKHVVSSSCLLASLLPACLPSYFLPFSAIVYLSCTYSAEISHHSL